MNIDIAQFEEVGYVVIPGLANQAVCSEMITVLTGTRGAEVDAGEAQHRLVDDAEKGFHGRAGDAFHG